MFISAFIKVFITEFIKAFISVYQSVYHIVYLITDPLCRHISRRAERPHIRDLIECSDISNVRNVNSSGRVGTPGLTKARFVELNNVQWTCGSLNSTVE